MSAEANRWCKAHYGPILADGWGYRTCPKRRGSSCERRVVWSIAAGSEAT